PTHGVPLAEPASLGRSSLARATLGRVEFAGDNGNLLDANFGYYMPDTIVYASIGVTETDHGFGRDDGTTGPGSCGVAPTRGLLATTDLDEDGWAPNATARYVGKMGNGHYSAATVSVLDPDDDDVEFGFGFDYYLDHTLSLGAAVNTGNDD